MTRYTNFARKRTYVEAGFSNEPVTEPERQMLEPSDEAQGEPETKKRKRSKSKKAKLPDNGSSNAGEGQAEPDGNESSEQPARPQKLSKFDQGKKGRTSDNGWPKGPEGRKMASEQRRLKRIDDRNADTICFACREKGHTARDCTNTLAPDALEGDQQKTAGKSGRDAVGICYRCGSRRHNLSRCREPVDPENPLPFASCFVCSGKGHLASKCPKNQAKGIYPNGGCCKLCKETTHLAKDCPLRKQEVVAKTILVGTGKEGGADEDDFHTFKRLTAEVDKSEKAEEKAKRKAGVKVGAHSGVVRAFGNEPAPKKKKVVVF